mmetsp:Transcript_18437/g.22441  ORF Transcript_18437/g.22441 Transcript_18437/m.22441 type:complete len:190 (+) Transcript_18437:1-570(+)
MYFGEAKVGIDPNLRVLVYRTVIRYADSLEEARSIIDRMKDKFVSTGELDLLRSIGASKNKEIVYEVLEWAIFSGNVRTQDMTIVVNGISSSVAWDWFRSIYTNRLLELFKTKLIQISALLSCVASTLKTAEQADEFEFFFDRFPEASKVYSILPNASWKRQDLESIRNKVACRAHQTENVLHYLSKQN